MKETLLELIDKKDYAQIKRMLEGINTIDVAELLEELEEKERLITFRILKKDKAVDVFAYLSSDTQEKIIASTSDKELSQLIDELYFDDMIDLLEEMPAHIVKKILSTVKEKERVMVNHFLNYPEDSAGSLMTIEFVDLKRDMTVKEALTNIKNTGIDKETIYTCYVIDQARKLEGIVSLKDLVTSSDDKKVEELTNFNVISANTLDDRKEVAQKFKKYDLLAIPVVDKENRLVGIITVDDIIDVIEHENTEDFYKMAAITPTETPYLEESAIKQVKERFLWLLILMISGTFNGYIIKSFEDSLQKVISLAMFIPVLMDTGGNAGSQSATVIIRGLALGHVKTKDFLKVFLKELEISVIAGVLLASVNFVKTMYIDKVSWGVSLTVSLAMLATVIVAKIVGGVLPLIANKLKMDPAIMASPLITTIVDAVSLTIYFVLATVILHIN